MADTVTDNDHHGGIGSGWIFLILIILLALLGFAGWTLYTRLRARRLGLPPPPLNPFASSSRNRGYSSSSSSGGGPLSWLTSKFRGLTNRRFASGAYESAGSSGYGGAAAGRRTHHGVLDPDEAWDARVGNEAYYEEQELGLQEPTAYSGVSGGAPGLGVPEEGRGRSRSRERELDRRYDEEMGLAPGRAGRGEDPFGEGAERSDLSLRGVSPRPIDTERRGQQHEGGGSAENSPSERRSMFRENV